MFLKIQSQPFVGLSMADFEFRVRPRFFDQVGHETMYASSANKLFFFTKSCHHQTYQNYEQTPQTFQNLYFQSHFFMLTSYKSI